MGALAETIASLKLGFCHMRDALLDLVAPARCMMCLREGDEYLCSACRKEVYYGFPQACVGCGRSRMRGDTCRKCREQYALDGLLVLGSYDWMWLRRGIHWLKFKSVEGVAPNLAEVLLPVLARLAPLDVLQKRSVLVPVPLHYRRERQRGFNQSLLIAQQLSRYTLIPCTDILRREKHTYAQSKLPDELRQQNIENAFICPESRGEKETAILVDDVATTGSTLNSAALALKKSGFKEVWGITLARG